jgi:hypothetical protein
MWTSQPLRTTRWRAVQQVGLRCGRGAWRKLGEVRYSPLHRAITSLNMTSRQSASFPTVQQRQRSARDDGVSRCQTLQGLRPGSFHVQEIGDMPFDAPGNAEADGVRPCAV